MSSLPLRKEKAVFVRDVGALNIGHELVPLSPQPGPRFRLAGGAVQRLDATLSEVARRPVSLPRDATLLNATADLSVVVAATADAVIVETDADGSPTFLIEAADSASFLPSGRVLVTAPVVHREVMAGRTYTTKGQHRLLVVDLTTHDVREQRLAGVVDVGVIPTPHPSDGSILLEAGAGQDGSFLFVARETSGGDIAVEALIENEIPGGFDPAGAHLLLTPHGSFDDRARVVRWPGLEEVAVLRGGDGALDGHSLDFSGCFLSADRVLLLAQEAGPLVCSAALEPLLWLDLDGREAEVESLTGLGREVFAATGWYEGSPWAAVWRVPELASRL